MQSINRRNRVERSTIDALKRTALFSKGSSEYEFPYNDWIKRERTENMGYEQVGEKSSLRMW